MALFISFEGGEGSGKSTQAERLSDTLRASGIPTLFIHEPGTTRLGLHIRSLIKGNPWGEETISHGAELFLFAASRAELVAKVLTKEVEKHKLVIIADRYADSTIAYQSFGRKMEWDLVDAINKLATQGLMPDITFLLDCPPVEGLRRVGSAQTKLFEMDSTGRLDEEGSRRFEEEPLTFHNRVRKGYLTLAESDPERWIKVDGTQAEDEVFESIWNSLQEIEKFQEMLILNPMDDDSRLLNGVELPREESLDDADEPSLWSSIKAD